MQPIKAYALTGAFAFGMLAVLYCLVWRRQRTGSSAMFMVGYLLLCILFSVDGQLQQFEVALTSKVLALFVVPAVLLVTLGFARYAGLPPAAVRRIDVACTTVLATTLALLLTSTISRTQASAIISGFIGFQALLCLWSMWREPGQGQGLVFAALMLHPAGLLGAWLGQIDPSLLRYMVIVPAMASGTAVLTTDLLRTHRQSQDELVRRQKAEAELQAVNATLEQRVALRTAELREVVAGLESFNRSVSHDLRGPLGGIAGVARLGQEALARDDRSTVQRMLTVIEAQAQTSTQLVTDLLALARVNDTELSPTTIDLDAFVRDTLAQMRMAHPDTGPLPVDVHPLPTVEADPGLLRQVYVNLLGNALKFSRDAQPPHVEVGAYREGGEDVLYVRDNGVGFDAKQAGHLFEPFHRLHGQRFAGHGVGLSIVKRIVERHGGRLWAQATPNAGATFYFSLPSARH